MDGKAIKSFYQRFSDKNFKRLAALSSLIGDLCLCLYLYLGFSNFERFNEVFNRVWNEMAQDPQLRQKLQGIDKVSPQFLAELHQLMMQSLFIMLALFLLFHLIVYGLYLANKKYARGYMYFTSWVVGIGLMLVALVNLTTPIALLYLVGGLAYLFVALGMPHHPLPQKEN